MSSDVEVLDLATARELSVASRLPDDARLYVSAEELRELVERKLDLPASHAITWNLTDFATARIERMEQPEKDEQPVLDLAG